MGIIFLATLIGFIVGFVGTGIGGVLAKAIPHLSSTKSRGHEGNLVGFSGGVMLGMVIWDLYPEACHLDISYAWGGVLAGIIFILTLRSYFKLGDDARKVYSLDKETLIRFTRTGILLSIGIAVHNLPEGVAVGTIFVDDPSSPLWRELSLLMALHNIPEGLAVATTLRMGKVRWKQIAGALILTELPMGIGAFLGGIIGKLSTVMSASALGFAAGAMGSLVWFELIPLSGRVDDKQTRFHRGWSGLAAGLLVTWLLIQVID